MYASFFKRSAGLVFFSSAIVDESPQVAVAAQNDPKPCVG